MKTNTDALRTYLDPNAQAAQFSERVLGWQLNPEEERITAVVALPDELQTAIAQKTPVPLAARVSHWLGGYLPPQSLGIDSGLVHVRMPRPQFGRTECWAVTIEISGTACHTFRAMMQGEKGAVPDLRHLLDEMQQPDAIAKSILERVQHFDEREDAVEVSFSVPKTHADEFAGRLSGHYGKQDLQIGKPENAPGPMVHLGAVLTGNARDRFISDYAARGPSQ